MCAAAGETPRALRRRPHARLAEHDQLPARHGSAARPCTRATTRSRCRRRCRRSRRTPRCPTHADLRRPRHPRRPSLRPPDPALRSLFAQRLRGAAAPRARGRRARRTTFTSLIMPAWHPGPLLRHQDHQHRSRQRGARPARPACQLPAVRRPHRRAAGPDRWRRDHRAAHRGGIGAGGALARARGCAAPAGGRRRPGRAPAAARAIARCGRSSEVSVWARIAAQGAGAGRASWRAQGFDARAVDDLQAAVRRRPTSSAAPRWPPRRWCSGDWLRARHAPGPDRQLHARDARGRRRLLRRRRALRRHRGSAEEERRPARADGARRVRGRRRARHAGEPVRAARGARGHRAHGLQVGRHRAGRPGGGDAGGRGCAA